ncbi:hypothetical protein L6164_026819 [Bauhinia variegata]|uniref:Uncharacterized protein n=1 Tax=Bauhinia variegata TaxID=167791 RepID=A0ACB9LSA5_BAUVA|nr:hypothetical protein L6164_026819 [Bauhinia variegata]
MAPELMRGNSAAANSSSNVYSYGMILLEMVGNVLNFDSGSGNSYFVSRIYERLSKGEELDLGNVAETEARIARKLCMVRLWCTQVSPFQRPSMFKVVEMLEGSTSDDFSNGS